MPAVYSQHGFDARFDWSEAGLLALIPFAGTVVIADVLSYSTAVDIAVRRGAAVSTLRTGKAVRRSASRATQTLFWPFPGTVCPRIIPIHCHPRPSGTCRTEA